MECKNPSSSDSVSLCPALRPPLLEIVNTLLALVVCSCLLVGMEMRPGLSHAKPEKTGFPGPDKAHVKKSAQNIYAKLFLSTKFRRELCYYNQLLKMMRMVMSMLMMLLLVVMLMLLMM